MKSHGELTTFFRPWNLFRAIIKERGGLAEGEFRVPTRHGLSSSIDYLRK